MKSAYANYNEIEGLTENVFFFIEKHKRLNAQQIARKWNRLHDYGEWLHAMDVYIVMNGGCLRA